LTDQSLNIFRDLRDRAGESEVLNEKGALHRVSGDLAQAEECHQQALDLGRAIASPWTEAHALAGLGRCALAAGHATQGETLLRQALEIFQQIGTAEATGVFAELDAATKAQSPRPDYDTRRPPGRIQPTLRDGHAPVAASPTDLRSPGDEDRATVTNRDLNVNASCQLRSWYTS
jgi:tetratricopeptide (TPR) repeat protein